jgi:hypothetical protein
MNYNTFSQERLATHRVLPQRGSARLASRTAQIKIDENIEEINRGLAKKGKLNKNL